MLNFQSIVFIWTQTWKEIFESAIFVNVDLLPIDDYSEKEKNCKKKKNK